MFKWNAQIIIDSFNAIHDAGLSGVEPTKVEEIREAAAATRFPDVDHILGDIHNKCEKQSVVA